MAPNPTPILHITHVRNLGSILQAGGLKTNASMGTDGTGYTNIAHQNIQDRRRYVRVPCGPGGSLHDYVPFYFAPRSPMLFVIDRGGVAGCPEGQGLIVHLVSSAQRVAAAGLRFVFTDGHGIMGLTEFFDDLDDLDEVDWKLMQSRYWNDTPADPDRCRRRQAEFLVHGFFPWDLVSEIGVCSQAAQDRVLASLMNVAHRPAVQVRTAWYY